MRAKHSKMTFDFVYHRLKFLLRHAMMRYVHVVLVYHKFIINSDRIGFFSHCIIIQSRINFVFGREKILIKSIF